MRGSHWALSALFLTAVGCGTTVSTPSRNPPGHPPSRVSPSPAAKAAFGRALAAFTLHDQTHDWSDRACESVARAFLDAAKLAAAEERALPEAHFDAALAFQRCGKQEKARAQLELAQKLDPESYRVKAALALCASESTHDYETTIRTLREVIRVSHFRDVAALVSLAALQMKRNQNTTDDDGESDMVRAKKNLQRALAIDDGYMPALNQLAIYYLIRSGARTRATTPELAVAGALPHGANSQELDLAALVATQSLRKEPSYAPLYNTLGLIQVELGNYTSAAKSFAQARRLDPRLFEAHMNFAALNLGFRGFEQAEGAYRAALELRPDDYEAKLGLALALRGQIVSGDARGLTPRVESLLLQAEKVAPERPEAYFNHAVLAQEYQAKESEAAAAPMLKKAARLYRDFVARAGNAPAFAEAARRASERRQDIEATLEFMAKRKP